MAHKPLNWDGAKTFFTADLHFSHKNILKYCPNSRPFVDIEQMNEAIVKNWNEVVPVDGHTFVLGDVSFERDPAKLATYLERMNGSKCLIMGNHDEHTEFDWNRYFKGVSKLTEIRVSGQRMTLCHFAMKVWNKSHHGAWQLYGHSHGTMPDPPDSLQMDVGMDCNNLRPFTFKQIQEHMAKKTFSPVDRHGT